ncbi:MAG TPA: GAF domain-containing protein, partial [Terriglobales bacterium]|nr:GAF domain-containing protein [Terriglobales bacterium]
MQKIAILYDASQAVISTFDLDEVLNRIVQIVQDYFHLHRVAIFLADHDSGALNLRTHAGWGRSDLPMTIELGTGLIGNSAQVKRPIYAPDVSKDPRYLNAIPSTRSELAIPLIVRDEVVGVLDCQSDQLDFFDAEASDLLILFSTQASIALQNARLYSLEQRKAQQLEAINYIAKQATASLDLDELLNKVCTLLMQSFSVDHVSVLLSEENTLVVKAHHGHLTPTIQAGGAIPRNEGLAARAMEWRSTIVENDVSSCKDYIPGFQETRAEICIPLVSFGEMLGVLALESSRKGAFEDSDIAPLESVAD